MNTHHRMDTRISFLGFVGSIYGGPPLAGKEIRNIAIEVIAKGLDLHQSEVLSPQLGSGQTGFGQARFF